MTRNFKTFKLLLLLLIAAGCAVIARVEPGPRTVGNQLTVTLDGAWNQVNVGGLGATEVWTMEGVTVDELLFYTGIKSGATIQIPHFTRRSTDKKFSFRSTMLPDEIAGLFESMLTEDGSSYELISLAPVPFGGEKGFRFEYSLVRQVDNVRLSGIGYGAVHKGELFAMLYMAPKLVFFPRHAERVDRIARSAAIRD